MMNFLENVVLDIFYWVLVTLRATGEAWVISNDPMEKLKSVERMSCLNQQKSDIISCSGLLDMVFMELTVL